jgi:RNA polymerase sigma-70 factor (ECF subfamily)
MRNVCAVGRTHQEEGDRVTPDDRLADRFEQHRPHVRAVAYRMLGSVADAEDAVQETWLRLSRTDVADVRELRGWLTTVVARICLDMLRARTRRREDELDPHLPDPIVTAAETAGPEDEAVLADSVGLALLVVLEHLSPAERLAFVLHDVFAVPFGQIATILGRTEDAAKQLASRARRRVHGASAPPDAGLRAHRQVVNAFLAAARDGDFEGLLAVLDPDVVLRADAGDGPVGPSQVVRGARLVAGQALRFADLARFARPVLVNCAPGLLAAPDGRPMSLLTASIRDGRIAELYILADPERLARLDLAGLDLA